MTSSGKRKPAPGQGRPRTTTSADRCQRCTCDRNAATGDGQLDLFAGRGQAEANTDVWWASTAMSAIQAIAATGREFQAFDLVEDYGLVEPDTGKRWGGLLNAAAKQGVIVPVGFARSRRPSAAGALCRTWRGAR